MTMLGRAYAWALRRVFAFALRRALGEALLDLDADQLDVALRSGTFEIRDAALRGSYLRRKLGDVVPVTCREGRVARLRAVIPWHALGAEPIAVELESLDLVVGPNPDFFRAAKRSDDKEDDPPNDLPPGNENENAHPAAETPVATRVAAVRDAVREAVRGMTVRAANVRVRFEATKTPADDATENAPVALLRFDEIAFGDFAHSSSSSSVRDGNGEARASTSSALSDDGSDPKSFSDDSKTHETKKKPSGSDIRERRARVLGARVAVAETRARRTDSGDAVTDIAEPSWRVVLDSGKERGAGVDATFGVRGPGESRRSSSSALDVFFGLDSDARVDVDPRTLAIVAALARAYGAPSPRASDVDEAEDPGCSGFRAREEEENTEDTAREPEGLAEAFGEVLSASRASVASRASSDASDDGSRSRSRESDDDSDDDAFFDAESHELPSVSGEFASLAGDEKARARKKTSKNATVAFAAPSLALRARWADADDEADADDDDCVVAAVRGVRASFAASRDGGFSVDASLESLDVREETSVGSTSESDRAAEALASLPFPFVKKTRNAAETKSVRRDELKQSRKRRRSSVAAAAPDGARLAFMARGDSGEGTASFTALGEGVFVCLDTALVGRLAAMVRETGARRTRTCGSEISPSDADADADASPSRLREGGPSSRKSLGRGRSWRVALDAPRARLAVVARRDGGVSCAAVDATRVSAEAATSSAEDDFEATTDASFDGADAYLYVSDQSHRPVREGNCAAWRRVARLEGGPLDERVTVSISSRHFSPSGVSLGVERDAKTLARRFLALVRGGDGGTVFPGRRVATPSVTSEPETEPLLTEASRALRDEALAEASIEIHVETGLLRVDVSGDATRAASALSRALAALPETHPMRVASPPPGAEVPPVAVSLRAARTLVAFDADREENKKQSGVVMTLRDAEAFFAASLAGAQRADHARVTARAGALTRGGADAATVDPAAGAASESFVAGDASAPGIVVAYARVPRDGVRVPFDEPGTGPGTERSAFAAIVTGGAARVSETFARVSEAGSSERSVGGDAADDDVADADVRRAVAAIAAAFAHDDDAPCDRTAGHGPDRATGPGPDRDQGLERVTCAFSSRVELRRASVALSSRTPRRRDSRGAGPGPGAVSSREGEGVEYDVRRGVVLLDALRFVFEEERGDGARRETFGSLRCLKASAHVARPNVSGDDEGAFPVPATARAARDAGFVRVISVDKLAVDRESRAHRADADDARVQTRMGARVSSLRCAFRRDALDAAAALARSLVAGSPSRRDASPDGAASGEETSGVAAHRDHASAKAAKDPDPIRVVDRVDPDAFAFAERRAPPRAAREAEPSTRTGVIDDFYGTDAPSRFAKSEPHRDASVEPSVESAAIVASRDRRPRSTPRLDASAAPFAPRERFERRSSPKKKVSVVGGVTLSPAFAAEAARLERARKIPFAKPASVRAAAARTMRASSLGVSAQWSKMGDSTRSFSQKSGRDFSPLAVGSEIPSESRNEKATPTARWFDGSAPAAASARRDGADATKDAVFCDAKNASDAEDAFWDAFRVPAAVAGKQRRTVSAVSVDVSRATLALRPGLEWRRDEEHLRFSRKEKHASSSEAKDGDESSGVRAVFVDASLRADAFSKPEDEDEDDDDETTTKTKTKTTYAEDDAETSRSFALTLGDAAVFTRVAAQNAPTTTLLAHDAGAAGDPRESGVRGALVRARLTETETRGTKKCPNDFFGEKKESASSAARGVEGYAASPEFALRVACLPLRLRFDRRAAAFLAAFFDTPDDADEEKDEDEDEDEDENERERLDQDEDVRENPSETHPSTTRRGQSALDDDAYFREVAVYLPRVRFDHAVRGVDPAAALDALRGGARDRKKKESRGVVAFALEMSNLLPLRGVSLNLERAVPGGTVRGARGVSSAFAQIARNWIEHVSRTQTHKFVRGLAPARSAENVAEGARAFAEGAAHAAAFLAGRAGETRAFGALRRRERDADARLDTHSASRAWRAAAAGAATLARALSVEALGLAAGVAAGATAVFETADDALAERFLERRKDDLLDGVRDPTPSSDGPSARALAKAASRASDAAPHPLDAREGARRAAASLRRGLGVAAAAARDAPVSFLPSAAMASASLTAAAARAARDVARGAKRSMERASIPGLSAKTRAASKHRLQTHVSQRESESPSAARLAALAFESDDSPDDAWADDLDVESWSSGSDDEVREDVPSF
jgi:hypothetical protein